MSGDLLVLEDVHTYYGEAHILQGISLTVRQGEVLALIGPSGCGKTTLLRSIGGLETVTSGRIAYAVLSFGGFLGMGAKLFAIPWPALALDAGEKRFILGVSKDRLENAPGFDKDHWPSMADPTWAKEVHAYYNVTPYWDEDLDTARDRRSTPDELTTPRVY